MIAAPSEEALEERVQRLERRLEEAIAALGSSAAEQVGRAAATDGRRAVATGAAPTDQ
jgi:hypothetical protein